MIPSAGKAITLKEIARRLGLSHGTVSKALRNNPEISQACRDRVMEMANQLAYKPNPMAAGLAEFKKNSKSTPVQAALAWINCWPNPKKLRSFAEFECYWQGAKRAAENFGYRLEEFLCNEQMPPRRLERILLARGIHGILIPPQPHQPDWGDFHWERFSTVRLSRTPENPYTHIVTADHVANTIKAVDQIRAHGYGRIGFIGSTATTDRRWLFEAGFLRAQMEMSPRDRVPIFPVDRLNPYLSQDKLTAWLKKEKPDAVIVAFGEMPEMLQKSGYRIPKDLGVVAMSVMDGKVDAGIYQNPEEIGRVAVLMLISLMNDNALGLPSIQRELLVKGTWRDGASLPLRGLASVQLRSPNNGPRGGKLH